MTIAFLVRQGEYYSPGYHDCVFKRKKDAVKYCRRDGFRKDKDDLYCGLIDGTSVWREVLPINYRGRYEITN